MNEISETCIANIVSWRVSQAVYRNTNRIVTKCIVTPLLLIHTKVTDNHPAFKPLGVKWLNQPLLLITWTEIRAKHTVIHFYWAFLESGTKGGWIGQSGQRVKFGTVPQKTGRLAAMSQYLLKHGGSYVRVHPSKMQMVHGSDSTGLPGKVLLPTHAHKTCQTDCDNVCVQSTGRDDVSNDPSAGVNDASDNVSDNVVNDSSENVSDNVVVNDDSDNEYDDDDDHGNVRDNRNVPLTPPVTPAHRPEEQPAQHRYTTRSSRHTGWTEWHWQW